MKVQVLDSYVVRLYTKMDKLEALHNNIRHCQRHSSSGRMELLDIYFKAPRFDKNGMVTSPLLWLLFLIMGFLVK